MKEPFLVIEPGRTDADYWHDLWCYRELFLILAWRDVSVRYKQTFIGIAWAVLRPLITMIIFTLIFGKLAKLPSEGESAYALLVLAGMLPWYLFSTALAGAADSLTDNSNLISKVYFPRMIIPAASIVTAFVDFLISLSILITVMFWYRFVPNWQILFLPVFVVLAILASAGIGLWVAALNVKYRDFRYVIPFALQIGLYISPVGFSSNIIPEDWRLLYNLNPMVGIIDGFRWCLLGENSPLHVPELSLSVAMIMLFLWFGIRRFRSTEKAFADLI